MVSDEEIRKFMEKYYPEWANNLELGRILYEKFKRRINNNGGSLVEKVKIGEILNGQYELGTRVETEGVIIDIQTKMYVGCPICGKSVKRMCEHLNNGVEPVNLYFPIIVVADDTGEIDVGLWTMTKEEFDEFLNQYSIGDVINVVGRLKQWNNKYEIAASKGNIKIVRKVQVDIVDVNPILKDIINTLRKLKRVRKQIYESMCRSKGVNPQVLIEMGYVIENGEYVEVVKNE